MTPASAEPAADAHKLWGGRFSGGPAPQFDDLNRSIGVDLRLWPFDIQVSKAWALALHGAGALTVDECDAITRGLDAVARRLDSGEQPIAGDEDVHTLVDRLLHQEAGVIASKLHTGRSRNDQVATGTRLWAMDAANRLDAAVRAVQRVILDQATDLLDVLMPSYTHMQRAIPISAAHWLLSHFWPLERDRTRMATARHSTAVLPLGSGAVAGCAYPISRASLQGSLGFSRLSANSMDAVSDRDFVAEFVFASALIATHLSRLAEDVIIYGSSEFGFLQFGDAYTSGSSMMPQKRNPDALELARGSAGRLLGDLTALLATLKGLPSSYNKDLQDDKRLLFDAVDTLLLVLPAVAGALEECTFHSDRMRAALSDTMMATDLADYLVRKGASFRDAHSAVGRLIRRCETSGQDLHELALSEYAGAHALFEADVFDVFSPERSVATRDLPGGTGPHALRLQLEAALASLGSTN